MNGMEVITTTSKSQRNQMYEDLRTNGNSLERQVVKFSQPEPDPDSPGLWRQTWSVAYPKIAGRKRRHG